MTTQTMAPANELSAGVNEDGGRNLHVGGASFDRAKPSAAWVEGP